MVVIELSSHSPNCSRSYWDNLAVQAVHDILWPGRSLRSAVSNFATSLPSLPDPSTKYSKHKDTYPLIDDDKRSYVARTSPYQGVDVVEPRDGGRDDTGQESLDTHRISRVIQMPRGVRSYDYSRCRTSITTPMCVVGLRRPFAVAIPAPSL